MSSFLELILTEAVLFGSDLVSEQEQLLVVTLTGRPAVKKAHVGSGRPSSAGTERDNLSDLGTTLLFSTHSFPVR